MLAPVAYTVTSSNPAVVSVESVMGFWTAVAKAPGTAKITATAPDGKTGSVTITVTSAAAQPSPEPGAQADIDLAANMEVRQEMIRLINEKRRGRANRKRRLDECRPGLFRPGLYDPSQPV